MRDVAFVFTTKETTETLSENNQFKDDSLHVCGFEAKVRPLLLGLSVNQRIVEKDVHQFGEYVFGIPHDYG